MRILIGVGIALAAIVVVVWIGLQVRPRPFDPLPATGADMATVPLPDDLPPPVARFYRTVYGDEIPVVESAVISGRMTLRLAGIRFPGRFRFVHDSGQGYRHYIEATLFGLPIARVNEYYLDGQGRMELPTGVIEDEPKIDASANLGLWAETMWYPAFYLTDPRVGWEAVDEHTALLRVPWQDGRQTFVARFDPETGLVRLLESMRYRDATDEERILWLNQVLLWEPLDSQLTMTEAGLIWLDEGTPWATFDVDRIVYNADVSEAVRASGP